MKNKMGKCPERTHLQAFKGQCTDRPKRIALFGLMLKHANKSRFDIHAVVKLQEGGGEL